MKFPCYTCILVILFTCFSCRSVDKLIEYGKYDEALSMSVKKLAGRKKRTKYVKALEKAYAQMVEKDLRRIRFLESTGHQETWDEIFSLWLKINRRQEIIEPFLPLTSKDGYLAYFELHDTSIPLKKAAENAADYHFERGRNLLNSLTTEQMNENLIAREAFMAFEKVRTYGGRHELLDSLQEAAFEEGLVHVKIVIEAPDYLEYVVPMESFFNRVIPFENVSSWAVFDVGDNRFEPFDMLVTVDLLNIAVSPEREIIHHFTEEKTIEEWIDLTDGDGNQVRDSVGQIVQVLKERVIEADVTEIERFKTAVVEARIRVDDLVGGRTVETYFLSDHEEFYSSMTNVNGDRRAISDETRRKARKSLEVFPLDRYMVETALNKVCEKAAGYLRSFDYL